LSYNSHLLYEDTLLTPFTRLKTRDRIHVYYIYLRDAIEEYLTIIEP